MTSKDRVLERERQRGRAAALDLASRAGSMDGTAIIAEESSVPMFVWGKDYSNCPAGAPIGYEIDGEVQIFTMITPVNTANYPGIAPETERSLYSLCHTKDPARAKPFIAPLGTSGMYSAGECCVDGGHVWKSLVDNNVYSPTEYAANWTDLGETGEVQV